MCCSLVTGCMEKYFPPINKYQKDDYVEETKTRAYISSLPVIGIAMFFFQYDKNQGRT